MPTLISELKDKESEEWSYLANRLESTSDWSGVVLYPNPRWSFQLRELKDSSDAFSAFAAVQTFIVFEMKPHHSIMLAIFEETQE